jgi:uncharacterized protein
MLNITTQPFSEYFSRQPDVIVAYLFGSVARGQETRLSDVDIAVLLDPMTEPEAVLDRQITRLTDLEQMARLEVQLTLLNHAPPLLAYQVIREGVLLHQRSEAERVAFQVKAMKEYFDVQPMLAFHNDALRQRIREDGLGRRRTGSLRTLEAAERIWRGLDKNLTTDCTDQTDNHG